MAYTSNIIWKFDFFTLPKTSDFYLLPTISYAETRSQGNDLYRGFCFVWGRTGFRAMFTTMSQVVELSKRDQTVVIDGKEIVIPASISYAINKMYHSLSKEEQEILVSRGNAMIEIIGAQGLK